MANTESLENVVLELRRGVIVLAALSQLGSPEYGYYITTRPTPATFAGTAFISTELG